MEVVPKYWWIWTECTIPMFPDKEFKALVMHFLDYPDWEINLN